MLCAVSIGIGDNRLLGGSNQVEGGGGFNFPIVKATVTIDGKTVVPDGKLTHSYSPRSPRSSSSSKAAGRTLCSIKVEWRAEMPHST